VQGRLLAAVSPMNTPHGYNWTFAYPMLLFIVVAGSLYLRFRSQHKVPGHASAWVTGSRLSGSSVNGAAGPPPAAASPATEVAATEVAADSTVVRASAVEPAGDQPAGEVGQDDPAAGSAETGE
jgi:hypothetical protein